MHACIIESHLSHVSCMPEWFQNIQVHMLKKCKTIPAKVRCDGHDGRCDHLVTVLGWWGHQLIQYKLGIDKY